MLIKNKINVMAILSFLILLVILGYGAFTYIQNQNRIYQKDAEFAEFCSSIDYENSEYKNLCPYVLSIAGYKIDFYTAFANIAVMNLSTFSFLLSLFVMLPALIYICHYFRHKMIINDAQRCDYKKIKHKIFTHSYMAVIIFPLIIIIGFTISFLYTKNFDYNTALNFSSVPWSASTMRSPMIFMGGYLLNVIIHSFLYVNVSLCVARKYHNYFVAAILSFLTVIGIECILEIGFYGVVFTSILHSPVGIVFNIMNFISFNDSYGILANLSVPIIMMILSFIAVHFLYKNKESLIIDCEKNE